MQMYDGGCCKCAIFENKYVGHGFGHCPQCWEQNLPSLINAFDVDYIKGVKREIFLMGM